MVSPFRSTRFVLVLCSPEGRRRPVRIELGLDFVSDGGAFDDVVAGAKKKTDHFLFY